MFENLTRELKKIVVIAGLIGIISVCIWSQYHHACIDGWVRLCVGIAALSGAVYIFRRY